MMSYIFCIFTALACFCSMLTDRGAALAASIPAGAQAGITLALSLAGSLCLWTGVGKLLEKAGVTSMLSRLLAPLLHWIFPGTRQSNLLSEALSGNICANLLGLGNAATPMGIRAIQEMARNSSPGVATDEMCRLIVLNSASIQLIPATVAALRASLGCRTPFDVLPAVWVTSLCSAAFGMTAAYLLGRIWGHD